MISPRVPVRLRWLSPAEHGRTTVPDGPRYAATIRLAAASPDAEWSVVLDGLRPAGRAADAVMSFVSDHAPVGVLQPGVTFQLFEGRWPVAEGHVCGERPAAVE